MTPEQIPNQYSDNIAQEIEKDTLTIQYENLSLDEFNPISPEVEFLIQREPIPIEKGFQYEHGGVLIDEKTEKMENILESASMLKNIPEEERVYKIMEILKENIQFAYPDTVKSLSKTNPELAEWINNKIWGRGDAIPMSELIEKGYGICRHLSVVYLWLAQEAGLKGNILSTDAFDNPIKNILRTDTNKPLFKMTSVGANAPNHAWTEIRLSSGKWIPVDPSTNLIGDTQEGLEMFNLANYKGYIFRYLNIKTEPKDDNIVGIAKGYFEPSNPVAKSTAFVSSKINKSFDHKGNLKDLNNTSYEGDAKLIISSRKESCGSKVIFREID